VSSTGSLSAWLPALLVIVTAAAALTEAGCPPATLRAKRIWLAGIVVFGSLAIIATVWQGWRLSDQIAALSGSTVSPEIANRLTVSDLTRQVKALEGRVKELEIRRQARTIAPDTAEKLASYLQKFGNHRVVVSCIPNDFEAYQYANQIVNVLKAANWDAQGPQLTKIFGDVRAPGINMYVAGDGGSSTLKILMDGFTKFNIPYQNRVPPRQAVPDSELVELFIGTQSAEQVNISAD
jgi:hypothetical protein